MVDRARAKTKEAPPLSSRDRAADREDEPVKMDLREFEDNLRFDRDALDDALMGQPDLFYRVSTELAMAISRRDGLKLQLEQDIAELDKQIRRKADDAGDKITEKAILSEIEVAPKIIDAKRRMGDASLTVAKLSALKEAYQQRSYAIKDMCGLYVANYFSTQAGTGARNDATTRHADDNRGRAGEARRNRE